MKTTDPEVAGTFHNTTNQSGKADPTGHADPQDTASEHHPSLDGATTASEHEGPVEGHANTGRDSAEGTTTESTDTEPVPAAASSDVASSDVASSDVASSDVASSDVASSEPAVAGPGPASDAGGDRGDGSDLGGWLAGSLRASPSKSLPPPTSIASATVTLAPVASPETLAPQMMDPELEDEDLAVLPGKGRSKNAFGKAAMSAFGALIAVLVFGYAWWQGDAGTPEGTSSAAAQPAAGVLLDDSSPGSEGPSNGRQQANKTSSEATQQAGSTPRRWVGAWAAPATEPSNDESLAPNLPGGPSVARFPDLPAAFWSELRRQERLSQRLETPQRAEERAAQPVPDGLGGTE